jgi:hypothetical protein
MSADKETSVSFSFILEAAPAICGSRIYLHGAVGELRRRQEMLYYIGASE